MTLGLGQSQETQETQEEAKAPKRETVASLSKKISELNETIASMQGIIQANADSTARNSRNAHLQARNFHELLVAKLRKELGELGEGQEGRRVVLERRIERALANIR